jgi:hypothetical protein
MRKLLRIDLSNNQYRFEDVPPGYANLGGRGLTERNRLRLSHAIVE